MNLKEGVEGKDMTATASSNETLYNCSSPSVRQDKLPTVNQPVAPVSGTKPPSLSVTWTSDLSLDLPPWQMEAEWRQTMSVVWRTDRTVDGNTFLMNQDGVVRRRQLHLWSSSSSFSSGSYLITGWVGTLETSGIFHVVEMFHPGHAFHFSLLKM